MRAKTRSGQKAGQMQRELDQLIAYAQASNVTSYLEVGARYGDAFWDVMRSLPPGSVGVAVDMPGDVWGSDGSAYHLQQVCRDLNDDGYSVHLIMADSADPDTVRMVRRFAPFGLALLDGDHRYDGIKADYANYAPMCDSVALHDIVGHGQRHGPGVNVEVPRFWGELQGDKLEFVAPGSSMGIGVIRP